jgi:hypothetical protein
MPESHRQIVGRFGALKSWANTVDRPSRTRNARAAAPSSIEWHAKRLPAKFDGASDSQRRQAAEAAHKAYFAELAMRSAAARRRVDDASDSQRPLVGHESEQAGHAGDAG